MNKTISAERTYQFVQYEPLKFSDTITDIPDEISFNPEAMKLLRYLQLIDIEYSYLRYLEIKLSEPRQHTADTIVDTRISLDEQRTTTFAQLLEALKEI